jgi:hypothetical protein
MHGAPPSRALDPVPDVGIYNRLPAAPRRH